MLQSDDKSLALTVSEAAATYGILKSREEALSSTGCSVLGKLEKFLYDTLSIEDMERLIRETSR